jgi:hypothetical protein
MINADDFMMFIVLAGFALCGAYFRAQYMEWRQQKAAAVKNDVRVRLLYHGGSARPALSVVVRDGADLAGCNSPERPAYPEHRHTPSIAECQVRVGACSQPPLPPSVLEL